MESRRNPLFLLKLMKQLSDDYCLVLVGDGPLFEEIKFTITNDHIDNVIVLGKKIKKIYQLFMLLLICFF